MRRSTAHGQGLLWLQKEVFVRGRATRDTPYTTPIAWNARMMVAAHHPFPCGAIAQLAYCTCQQYGAWYCVVYFPFIVLDPHIPKLQVCTPPLPCGTAALWADIAYQEGPVTVWPRSIAEPFTLATA